MSVELFIGKDCPFSARAASDLAKRPGLSVKTYDVTQDQEALRRLYGLAKSHGVEAGLPMLHALDRIVVGYSPDSTPAAYDEAFRIEIFVRSGCPHCAAAKSFLRRIEPKYPGIRFAFRDVVADEEARQRWKRLNAEHGIRMPGVPSFLIGRKFTVGYSGDTTTGRSIQERLDAHTKPGPPSPAKSSSRSGAAARSGPTVAYAGRDRFRPANFVWVRAEPAVASTEDSPPTDRSRPPPLPDPGSGESVTLPPPLPDAVDPTEEPEASSQASEETAVELPWIGPLDPRIAGMPLFTIAIGLVDGFNPCAMWVLLFLLSILVNVKDRRKVFAVAATFVFVSGAVYFAFMAAWLNVFHFVGLQRWSEILLGVVAILIGLVNVKDFFAFKKGVSLSIPESAKPGIYARARDVVTAKNLLGAIVGVATLAVLVNFVELLCTAGLPAVFTRVLTMREYPLWKEYSYLSLYIAAYVFDDSLMVAAAIVTMNKFKLQERGGRWLKLLSGCCILLLGLVLCFAPQLLV